jgi:Zn-dependent peptidase ImmA (M78 family)
VTTHSYTSLMRRLSRGGFDKAFVRPAILPDWWDESCTREPDLLPDLEIRVARFLGVPLASVRDPDVALSAPDYLGAKLRRTRSLDSRRLMPAIHAALQIGAAVSRCLRDSPEPIDVPPPEGLAWHEQLRGGPGAVTLDDILADLWRRGIPVVPIDLLPCPSFQGMAATVAGRPVILLAHKHDEPGRVAFFVAHEVGHIAAGDCETDQPAIDEEDEIVDDALMEEKADRYATNALVGGDSVPEVEGSDFRQLASNAARIERATGADASIAIFAWAARTRDYATATLAVRALYRGSGARRTLRQYFDRYVDVESATESDRALLRCVHGEAERDETAA